ncbi:4-hydroxyphenylpyruvate dioxygenase [Kribbella sandramycini]|uniref:4-hydroxymandelate synthase n=1 Tax=Kribbella sandramycini TaxID=60450 RepID=A0A7Y4L0Y5_9ACTN|nr:4-hydroxyphenylpyruvate dioxygenase [Kribbella sandramycini]MBB6564596.1 4-hydroxymandelate synthase [Kribbella sandramycini]NOL42300.1 4-hydroxyphenylpyruvate dioxygenase [Kribbella sandramycini]
MEIYGIDHVELYVGDAKQAAFYLAHAFGLQVHGHAGPESGLAGQRSLLLREDAVQIVLTSGLDAEHPAARYVQRHGDGVAVVGLEVDNTAVAYTELLSRGAQSITEPATYTDEAETTVVIAEVAGFGDVIHRLVERHGPRREFLPGAFVITEPAGGPDEKLFSEIDHLAICVPSGELEPTARFYSDVFGFPRIFEEYIEVAGQGMDSKVVQSPSKHVTFTLIEPDPSRRPGQIDDFLTWHAGAGVQHIALRTSNIVEAVSTLTDRGVNFLGTPAAYYQALSDRVGEVETPIEDLQDLGILVDRDHWGQLLQIFTESMHVRRTLFLEIIERRGAMTFGSGNIKALYEAKERELAHDA